MSCLGKVCTVQHRNKDCRGGRNAREITNLKAQIADLADQLTAERERNGRLEALICPHRQSRCVDCIELHQP